MANFDSNWDALAGAGGLTWTTLLLSDAVDAFSDAFPATRPPPDIISISETAGVWSVAMDNVADTNANYEFAVAPPTGIWALFIRFTEFTHPAAGTGIQILLTASTPGGGVSDPGAGYRYPVNTANVYGGVWINEVDFNNAVEVTRASLTKIEAVGHGNDIGAAGFGTVSHAGTANNWGVQSAGGGAFTSLTLSIATPNAVGVQTFGFKVEYALVTLGDLP